MSAYHPLLHPYLGPEALEVGYSIAQRHLPAACREPLSDAAVKYLRKVPYEINREAMRLGYRAPFTGTMINIWNGLVSRAARGIYNSGRWVLRWFITAGVATISRAMKRFQQFGLGQVQHMTRRGDDGRPMWTHAAFIFALPAHLTHPAIEGSPAPEVDLPRREPEEDEPEEAESDAEPEHAKSAVIRQIIPNNSQRTADQNGPGVTPEKTKEELPQACAPNSVVIASNDPIPQRPLSTPPPPGIERRPAWAALPPLPPLTGPRLRENLREVAVVALNFSRACQNALALMDGVLDPKLTHAQSQALVNAETDLRWEMQVAGRRALPDPDSFPDAVAEQEARAEAKEDDHIASWLIVGEPPPEGW